MSPVKQLPASPVSLPPDPPSSTDEPLNDDYFHVLPSRAHKLVMFTAVVAPFVGLIAAITLAWQFGWMSPAYLALFVGGWLLTGLGITIGFHRLIAHRSFETYRWVRAFWMTMGSLSVEGSPLIWCAVHRRHHEMSDKQGDPHSPHLEGPGVWNSLKGFWYAHCGWLFTSYWTEPNLKRYVPDLLRDRVLMGVDRLYFLLVLASLLIPTAIGYWVEPSGKGALLGFLWGGLARIWFTHHVTWSINSVCHLFGRRDYESQDLSRNNALCGLLALGEGWHNNHHAFPTSARHGLEWWQFDASWVVIRTMQALGLAWDVRVPTRAVREARRLDRAI